MECELAMFVEKRKCKEVIAWSGDFGIDQYVSWNLTEEELALDAIWEKCEEFWKPQSNVVRARSDLLTSFRQGDRSMDEWYNAVQTQVALAKDPQETAKILHRDIFRFFLRDEEFVSKTINDSVIDLNKFPARKVRQLSKKMETSKATAKHIKQLASESHATQIHLMQHECTEMTPASFKENKKESFKSRQATNKHYHEDKHREGMPQVYRTFNNNHQAHASQEKYSSEDRCNKCGDFPHVEGFRCPASKYQCKTCPQIRSFQ